MFFRIFITVFILLTQVNQTFGNTNFIDQKLSNSGNYLLDSSNTMEHINNFDKIFVPRINLEDSYGSNTLLKDFQGKFIILYFWASWCMDCRNELVALSKLQDELLYKDIKDVLVISVSTDKDPKELDDLFNSWGVSTIKPFRDSTKELVAFLGVSTIPTTYLIDKNSYIRLGFEGKQNWLDPNVIQTIIAIKDI